MIIALLLAAAIAAVSWWQLARAGYFQPRQVAPTTDEPRYTVTFITEEPESWHTEP